MVDKPQHSVPMLQRAAPGRVQFGGLLGEALEANRRGRLSTFIVDESSPAIALFDPEKVRSNNAGDWYGEHAGKWLYAAARAAVRCGDEQLRTAVLRVADHLVRLQDQDGYLGTYAPERRFMHRQPPKPPTWDGAPTLRTWDIWTHSYLMLGLLEVFRQFGTETHLDAVCRIANLCWRTLTDGGIDITDLGNHHGMSATILIDPAVELHLATGERRYLDLALLVLEQAEKNPQLKLLTKALAGVDASEIATGKAYQLLWNLVGIAKLHRATGDERYLSAARNLWRNIRDHHLSLGGGPCGGVGHRSREVFNPAPVFSPYAYVETCATLAWVQLNGELLSITGEAIYADEIERSAYNDLLGAQAPNGEDWCYYSFPNGRRVFTTYWRCCKSSGALALEELPAVAYGTSSDGGIAVNLFGPSDATLRVGDAGTVRLEQRTHYPFDGAIEIRVTPERVAPFAIRIRIPSWAGESSLRVNETSLQCSPQLDGYVHIEREWRVNDVIQLQLPMIATTIRRSHTNVQQSCAPDGSDVSQEVLHFDYLAVRRGPMVYACALIDGYKVEETLRIDAESAGNYLETQQQGDDDAEGPAILLRCLGRSPLTFHPYYRAGGRRDRTWRLTWMSLAPE